MGQTRRGAPPDDGFALPPSISSEQHEADERFMREALAEARAAAAHEDVPIGAVVVKAGEIIARGHNRREIDEDPTAHAEIVALRLAAEATGHWRLEGCTLYVTLEPCYMCAGACVNARVERLVFAAPDTKAGAVGSLANVPADTRLNHRPEVAAGVLLGEAATLLRDFFKARRG